MADRWVRKTVRLTEKEASILAQRAGEAGIPENRYIRILIRQKPADYPAVQQHLKALINETNRIGNNVNQIVHGNHMGFYSKEDRENLEAYMRRLNLRVKEVADKLGD